MSYTVLPHVGTGELATASLHNTLLDDLATLKISIDDSGHIVWSVPVSTVTGAYAITATDDVVLCSGTFIVTLLTAVGRRGKPFTVKNIGTGVITMASTSSQTIDGAAAGTYQLFAGDSLTFVSDNANWAII